MNPTRATAIARDFIVSKEPLHITALNDPVIEMLGHDPRSGYAELYWLPIIGPTALWAYRRLAMRLDACPEGFPLPLVPFAAELGLGASKSGKHSPVVATLARLVVFHHAEIQGDHLAVHTHVPPLPARYQRRLPGHLAAALQQELAS